MVKFLNNLLAQITPFLFYAVGGYFALKGSLDIGQLVAVIAAYRDLPPPLKELIDWDQQRLDVQVKYDQVVQHFSPERLLPADELSGSGEGIDLIGPLVVENLQIRDPHGGATLDGVSLTLELPARVGLVTDGTAAASNFARAVARRNDEYAGSIRIGDHDLAQPARLRPEQGDRLCRRRADPVPGHAPRQPRLRPAPSPARARRGGLAGAGAPPRRKPSGRATRPRASTTAGSTTSSPAPRTRTSSTSS